MSIFLVGGGPDTLSAPLIWDQFLSEVRDRTATKNQDPRLVVVLFDHEGSAEHFLLAYSSPISANLVCQVVVVKVRTDESVDASVFDRADGIVVGGGPTPEYHRGLQNSASTILSAVSGGVPYLGFSAGAMVAASDAVLGGYLIEGREVCTEEWAEGLDDVTIVPGLGLVPFTVDVHASQAGTLGRAVSIVHGQFVKEAVAIDEDTAVVVQSAGQQNMRVIGRGNAWIVDQKSDQTTISVVAGT